MSKANTLIYFCFALLAFLALRLVELQLIQHDKYTRLALNNSSRVSIIRAPRGIIYDRNHKILATSKQSLSVMVYPAQLKEDKDKQAVAKTLSGFLDLEYEDLYKMFAKMNPTTPLPLTIDNDVTLRQAIKILDMQTSLPGIVVEKQAIRYYPEGDIGAHFLGYVGQVNSRELKSRRGLHLGDVVGKDGLEQAFDAQLRGIKGERRTPVDRFGHLVKDEELGQAYKLPAVKGEDLQLTIDLDLQKALYESFKKYDVTGAGVITDPNTGEILAMVSYPSFDPNIFTKPISSKKYSYLSYKKAFLNRALSKYTPGSIWKPLSALAALEHGVTNGYEVLKVTGAYMMGGFRFGDWTSKKSWMDLTEALAWSRNTYFYQIAKRMKPEWISELGAKFGAGKVTGIEIPGESKGTLPSPSWKRKYMRKPWFPGNTLHYSIGQSFLLMTPLQAAKLVSGIATRGQIPQLHLVEDEEKCEPESQVKLKDSSWNIVHEGMRKVVSSGTAQVTNLPGIIIAGKTGSAEVRGYKHSTHAWFTSYAPAGKGQEPEIAMALFGEGAGHGGSVCAPIARDVYSYWMTARASSKLP